MNKTNQEGWEGEMINTLDNIAKRKMDNKANQEEWEEGTIHAILAGVLLNGYIQGQTQPEISDVCLDFAKKELKKTLQTEKEKMKKELEDWCEKNGFEHDQELLNKIKTL